MSPQLSVRMNKYGLTPINNPNDSETFALNPHQNQVNNLVSIDS